MALVEARDGPSDSSVIFDDVITGKGRSLNILLQYGSVLLLYANVLTCESGELRPGETLTVEAVVEHQKQALYSVCFTFLCPLIPGANCPDLYWRTVYQSSKAGSATLPDL